MKTLSLEQLKKRIPKKYHHKLELTEERIDWDEGEFGARLFLSTADGWCWEGQQGQHLFTFDTWDELKWSLWDIKECNCRDCQVARQKGLIK